MKFSLVGELPRHLYVYVDTEHTHQEPRGFIPAVWFGLVSYPGRMWGCNVMLESGAIYRNLPLHAIAFSRKPAPNWSKEFAQRWDCYGTDFSTIEYRYLAGLDVKCRIAGGAELGGEYLFTAAPIGDGFSAAPDQSKEFFFIKLENGWVTVQPTNHVIFREWSFTDNKLQFPTDLRPQTEVFTCE